MFSFRDYIRIKFDFKPSARETDFFYLKKASIKKYKERW